MRHQGMLLGALEVAATVGGGDQDPAGAKSLKPRGEEGGKPRKHKGDKQKKSMASPAEVRL